MLFKDIIGQEKVKERFLHTVKEGRISHGQMLLGPEGCGKLALAIAYAQYVCCQNKKEDDSCGECPSCRKYQKLIHPDLHFVFPVVKNPKHSKAVSDNYISEWREMVVENPYFNLNQWYEKIGAENKQGSIYVDESSEILRKLNLKTFESEYKVMIIWLPEKMNAVASNKLLKILEEPPEKTLFLLVSENSGEIIQTILSRTQLIKVPRIDDKNLSRAIKDKYHFDASVIDNLIHLSNGNYISLMENISASEFHKYNFDMFVQLMRLAYTKSVIELFKWVEDLSEIGRERQKNFLVYAQRMIRENFIMNAKNPKLIYLSEDEMQFSKKFSPFINEKNVLEIAGELDSAHYHIERNGNSKIIFMDMSLNLIKLLKQ